MLRAASQGLLWVACVLGLGWSTAGCFVRTGPELPSNIGVSTARRQAQQRQDDFGKSPAYEGAVEEPEGAGSADGHDGEPGDGEHGSSDASTGELEPLQLPSFARSRQSAGVPPPPSAAHSSPELLPHVSPDHGDEGPERTGHAEPPEPVESAPVPIE